MTAPSEHFPWKCLQNLFPLGSPSLASLRCCSGPRWHRTNYIMGRSSTESIWKRERRVVAPIAAPRAAGGAANMLCLCVKHGAGRDVVRAAVVPVLLCSSAQISPEVGPDNTVFESWVSRTHFISGTEIKTGISMHFRALSTLHPAVTPASCYQEQNPKGEGNLPLETVPSISLS